MKKIIKPTIKSLGLACMLAGMVMAAGAAGHKPEGSDSIHRPKMHFSPPKSWMNDPNGLVFQNGVYHLFYQHHPASSVWGPMHWGHATSHDLVHWTHEPIALYPDSLGTIFSGSAVVDKQNTSGFGKDGQSPLVAIFTHHNHQTENSRNDFQNQSLAYSLDNGKTWIKYAGNPVLKNPGIKDFRDPKVMWHEKSSKWIMSLATQDCITFYSSPDLKNWTMESSFGKEVGAHGGVWECPDLVALKHNGKEVWVLLVSINPGGPNGGSATQYFLGNFDGHAFKPFDTRVKWVDYGPDDYAGVTWSNTGDRNIFIGWMSNWEYANQVPTETWRNAATIPRELKLVQAGNELLLASVPVKELSMLHAGAGSQVAVNAGNKLMNDLKLPCTITFEADPAQDVSLVIGNQLGEKVVIGYDKSAKNYYIDRSLSGKTGFNEHFAAKHVAPRFSTSKKITMTLVLDVSSVELFADDGLTVMTSVFFPREPYTQLQLSQAGSAVSQIRIQPLQNIWK